MSTKQTTLKNKLLESTKWLTLHDAAKELSRMVDAEISPPKILQYALEGELKLSINLVKSIKARVVKIVPFEEVEWYKTDFLPSCPEDSSTENNEPPLLMKSLKIDDNRYLNLTSDVKFIKDIWDLPMWEGGRSGIEREYHKLTGGPKITTSSRGVFVKNEDGSQIYQLLETKKKDRSFPFSSHRSYVIQTGLPHDSVLVVRPQVLIDFKKSLDEEQNLSKPLERRAENTYLNIIGALLDITTGDLKDNSFSNETKLREFLAEKYRGYPGMSERTLAEKFALAKKRFDPDTES
jgi:hypothetical protein